MRIKTILVLTLFIVSANVHSQVSLLSFPPPNDFMFEDLWNLNIINSVPNQYKEFYINIKISEAQRGELLSINSKTFNASFSAKNITKSNLNEVKPFETVYTYDNLFSNLSTRGGFFPAGEYKFTYTLMGDETATPGTFAEVANTQQQHVVLVTAPLQLIAVFDKDTIEELNPAFSWIPVSGTLTIADFENTKTYGVKYRIEIAELLLNQTPYAAITSNPKIYLENELTNTFVTYPFSARKLEPGKTYVWQVHAVIAGKVVTSSEVWQFTIRKKEKHIVPQQPVLVKQNAELAFCHVKENTVSFAYYEEYDQTESSILNAELFDKRNNRVKDAETLNLSVKKGMNIYHLSVCPEGLNLSGSFYQLIITNSKNEKWYLRIYNEQANNSCN